MSRGLEPGDEALEFDLPNANPNGPEHCTLSSQTTDVGCIVRPDLQSLPSAVWSGADPRI